MSMNELTNVIGGTLQVQWGDALNDNAYTISTGSQRTGMSHITEGELQAILGSACGNISSPRVAGEAKKTKQQKLLLLCN